MASSSASKYFEIPKFFLFSEKGIYSGSSGERDFNYKVVPFCPKEGESLLKAFIWSGEKCIDCSENVTEKDFSLNEEGYKEMLSWLESEYLSREETLPVFRKRQERARQILDEYLSMEDFFERRNAPRKNEEEQK